MVKNLPALQETWVRSLGQEDPLENGIATHFSILAWIIPWTEEPGGVTKSRHINTIANKNNDFLLGLENIL